MRSKRRLVNQINVVPFIDVMLVLLIVFMVAAPLIHTGEIKLPSVGQSLAPPTQTIEVIIKADQSIAVREPGAAQATAGLKREQVVARVKQAQAKNPNTAVSIAADKAVRYEAVVGMLSALNVAGVQRVGLLAETTQ
jgi:biopolymer transport protein TolR